MTAVPTDVFLQIGQVMLALPNAMANTGIRAGVPLLFMYSLFSMFTIHLLTALYAEYKARKVGTCMHDADYNTHNQNLTTILMSDLSEMLKLMVYESPAAASDTTHWHVVAQGHATTFFAVWWHCSTTCASQDLVFTSLVSAVCFVR